MPNRSPLDEMVRSPLGFAMFEFLLRWNRGVDGIPDEANVAIVSMLAELQVSARDDDIRDVRSRLLNLGLLIGKPAEQADTAILDRIEELIRSGRHAGAELKNP